MSEYFNEYKFEDPGTTLECFLDMVVRVEEKILETWDEVFELQEQNVVIYEKLDDCREKIDKLTETLNNLSDKISLPYNKENSMPTPREISYWTNFGHFPEKESN